VAECIIVVFAALGLFASGLALAAAFIYVLERLLREGGTYGS
jgi:hypothetical protein